MLSVKQSSIKYHFLSLWYDSTWDWTQISRAMDVLKKIFKNKKKNETYRTTQPGNLKENKNNMYQSSDK